MSCLVVGALWRSTAVAQPVELDWTAPAECPAKARAEAEIATLLDAARTRRPAPHVAAKIEITQAGGRYRLRLRIVSETHNAARELHARRCEELVEVAAWLVALAVDPALPSAVPEAGPAGADVAPPPPANAAGATPVANAGATTSAPARDAAEASARATATAPSALHSQSNSQSSAPRDRRQQDRSAQAAEPVSLSLHAGGSGGLFAGSGADVQAALSAFAALGADWSYTQARITAHLPRSIEIGPEATAQLWSFALNLSQCALWGRALRGGPCGVLTGIRTRVEASGVSGGDPRPALWATAGPGMQLLWRIRGRLELSLASHVGLPISPRPRFSVAPLGTVISAEPWSVDAALGLAFTYP